MLKRKGAAAWAGGGTKSSRDALDRHISGRTLGIGHGGQHLALARAFQVAVELLVNGHSPHGRVPDLVVLRIQLYFEGAGGVHWSAFLGCGRLGRRDEAQATKSHEQSGDASCHLQGYSIFREGTMVSPL